jgi:hypothetical protein
LLHLRPPHLRTHKLRFDPNGETVLLVLLLVLQGLQLSRVREFAKLEVQWILVFSWFYITQTERSCQHRFAPKDSDHFALNATSQSLLEQCKLRSLRPHSRPWCKVQRKSGFLKVFRCGPLRDDCRQVMMACVDKPRKEEAAVGWELSMGKVS